jgi:hypothetical protein
VQESLPGIGAAMVADQIRGGDKIAVESLFMTATGTLMNL